MQANRIKRRNFLQSATTLAGAIIIGGFKNSSAISKCTPGFVRIESPFHGAILNHRHGKEIDGGLKIGVEGEAPMDTRIIVNGVTAKRAGRKFVSRLTLRDEETEIKAIGDDWFGQNEHSIRVVWDKNSFPRYCFEIDDNIYFFRDIAQKKYKSLFDCFYLKGLRELNRKYGIKVVLNIYYSDGKEFNLTQFPDHYKSEWQENANWLKLAFHAYANDPDRPYQYASANQLISDLDLVNEQIYRFAGEKAFTPPTIIHWGMIQPAVFKPLADRGIKVLRGYFRYNNGRWDINSGLNDVRSEYLSRNDVLKDFESGIVFSKVNMVFNTTPIELIVPRLENNKRDPNLAEIMDLMTHEQHFWPFYFGHVPDHFKRLDTAFKWVTENGYKPVFFHEGLLGA